MQILEEAVVPPDEVILETQEVTADNAQEVMDSFTGGGDAAPARRLVVSGEAPATTAGEEAPATTALSQTVRAGSIDGRAPP